MAKNTEGPLIPRKKIRISESMYIKMVSDIIKILFTHQLMQQWVVLKKQY